MSNINRVVTKENLSPFHVLLDFALFEQINVQGPLPVLELTV